MASSLTLVFPSSPRQSSTASKLTVDYSSLGDVQEWCNALGPDGSVVGSFRGTGLLAFAIASSVSWLEDKGKLSTVAMCGCPGGNEKVMVRSTERFAQLRPYCHIPSRFHDPRSSKSIHFGIAVDGIRVHSTALKGMKAVDALSKNGSKTFSSSSAFLSLLPSVTTLNNV